MHSILSITNDRHPSAEWKFTICNPLVDLNEPPINVPHASAVVLLPVILPTSQLIPRSGEDHTPRGALGYFYAPLNSLQDHAHDVFRW